MPVANLRSRRLAAGFTQAEAAGFLGVSRVALSYWETGARSVPLNRLPRLAQLYRCSLRVELAPA